MGIKDKSPKKRGRQDEGKVPITMHDLHGDLPDDIKSLLALWRE